MGLGSALRLAIVSGWAFGDYLCTHGKHCTNWPNQSTMLDLDKYIVKYMSMSTHPTEKLNIGMVKEHFSAYVTLVEQGKTIQICRRNRPVAELVRLKDGNARNRTRLGSDEGSVTVKCDLTAPAIPEKDWGMLQ